MKKLILIRIGQVPNPLVTAALVPHMTGRPVAFPIPGAIVSIFDTESSLEEVSESVKETGAFFFLVEHQNSKIHLPEEVMEMLNQAMGTPEPEPTREQTVDEILDLIRERGVECLTEEQKRILEQGL
jgi:hypothetical protein